MSRLTLRLPESLHRNLANQAESEGVSLNQMIVYLLARATTATDLEKQRSTYERLLGRFSDEEAEEGLREVLAARAPRRESADHSS